MTRFCLFLGTLGFAACAQQGELPDPAPTNPVEGSAAEVHPPSALEEPVAVVGDEAEPPAEATNTPNNAEEFAPPALPSLMRQAGYSRASEANLADFVHAPPGAVGEAGVFGDGERAIRVALIAYPNPRYVRPHVTDVLERIRVLPNPREAVLYHHRWVVHLMAVDRETADQAADRLREILNW